MSSPKDHIYIGTSLPWNARYFRTILEPVQVPGQGRHIGLIWRICAPEEHPLDAMRWQHSSTF